MARQSIPANPIDEQILALQRQIASSQNELDALREIQELERAENERVVKEQKDMIERMSRQMETTLKDYLSLKNKQMEKDSEIKYLQGQLEQLITEKLELQTRLTTVETEKPLSDPEPDTKQTDDFVEKIKSLEEELVITRSKHEADQLELQAARDQVADLTAQIDALKAEQMVNPADLPPCPNVLTLRQLQSRVQALALAYNS